MAPTPAPCACDALELRQYTLRPGQRDALIELFEREFVDPQLELGIALPGLFRDADDPDRFVWCRAFPDLASRARMLAAFYDGPVWRAHREAANATMVDSDNVLLLRPLDENSARLPLSAPVHGTPPPPGVTVATVYELPQHADPHAFHTHFRVEIASLLRTGGGELLGVYASETRPNDYPRLPVREGENVMVWFAGFADFSAHARLRPALTAALRSVAGGPAAVLAETVLRLQPTSRSSWPIAGRTSP